MAAEGRRRKILKKAYGFLAPEGRCRKIQKNLYAFLPRPLPPNTNPMDFSAAQTNPMAVWVFSAAKTVWYKNPNVMGFIKTLKNPMGQPIESIGFPMGKEYTASGAILVPKCSFI